MLQGPFRTISFGVLMLVNVGNTAQAGPVDYTSQLRFLEVSAYTPIAERVYAPDFGLFDDELAKSSSGADGSAECTAAQFSDILPLEIVARGSAYASATRISDEHYFMAGGVSGHRVLFEVTEPLVYTFNGTFVVDDPDHEDSHDVTGAAARLNSIPATEGDDPIFQVVLDDGDVSFSASGELLPGHYAYDVVASAAVLDPPVGYYESAASFDAHLTLPEPTTVFMLGIGGMLLIRRSRRARART